jgi:photosystem II stability/assembly factor-like uncharacterized protein
MESMKKASLSLLILLIAAFLTNQSYSQIDLNWKWMHPKPQGNTLRYVKMFSATNWIAIGYAGAFMSTSNGGTSWTIYMNAGGTQAWGLGRTLYSGWFFNMNTGLVCGSSGWIGRTTTGGASWDSIASGVTATLYGMHFINSNTGFIGGSSGTILKTTNGGVSWTAVTSGTTSTLYNIFALDVNHIYVPSTSGNLRITTNGGTTWTQVATGGSTLYDVGFMDANTGFVTGSSGHVRLTTDGGANWTGVNPSSTSTKYDLTAIPPMGLAEGFENTTFPPPGWTSQNVLGTNVWTRNTSSFHSGVASAFINYQSTGGEDWLKSPPIMISAGDSVSFWARKYFSSSYPPDSLIVKVSPTADTNTASFTGVAFRIEVNSMTTTFARYSASLNAYAGQTVRVAFQHKDTDGNGCYLDDVYIGPVGGPSPSQVYVTGDPFYIFKSTNLGTNWTQIDHLNPSQIWTSTFYSFDVNGNAMVAVGASGLMNRSTNGGANWTNYNTWILAGTFYDVWAEHNNTKVLAVGSGSNNTKILYSSNGGQSWVPRDIPTTKYFRSISMVDANTGYIAGSSGGMFKTTNGGVSWDSLPFPSSSALLYRVDFVNANTGWTSSSSSPYLWKTTDGGATWNSQAGPTVATYCVDMVDANTGWIVGSSGNVRKTVDGGSNWVAQTSNYSSTLYWIKMLNANSGYLCGAGGTLRRTTNGGTNWDTVATPYSTTHYKTDWVNVNNGILCGSSTGYTCKTTNGGTSWSIETTSGSTMYGVYMNTPDSAWACGSIQGIYKWAMAPQGVVEWKNEIPTTYTLSQNYPNPFNPVTTIKFGIPKAGKVSLKVYDITGRLVSALINDAPLNAGTVTYRFDGSNLASGVYFYSLIVDNNKIDTKKMVLVK